MTGNGIVVVLVGLAALGGGVGLGYPAGLAVAAVAVAALVAGLPIRPWPGRPLHVTLTVTPISAERGATATIEVAAPGPVVAHLRVGDRVVIVEAGGRWTTPPLPRGRLPVAVQRVVALGPLALWQRLIRFTATQAEITVRPRHTTLAGPLEMVSADEDGRPVRAASGGGAAFAGLREYEPGDDLRQIDWAASARSGAGEVYVRQFAPARVDESLVVLDPAEGDDPEAFEVAVDLAYSFVLAGAGLVLAGDTEPVRSAAEALIRLAPRKPPSGRTARPVDATVVITASPERAEELRRAYHPVVPLIVAGRDLAAAAEQWVR
jgi:uncharacterized protein (DUF58 family)